MKLSFYTLLFFALSNCLCAQTVYEDLAFTSGLLHFTGAGKAEVLPNGGPKGERCNKITTTSIANKRFQATRYKTFGRKNYQLRGEKIEYTFQVKGKGSLEIICMNRGDRDSIPGNAEMVLLKKIELSPEWQSVKVIFDCLSPRFGRTGHMTYRLSGEGNFFILADEHLKSIPPAGKPITASPRHLVTYPGENVSVTFTLPEKAEYAIFDGAKESKVNAGSQFKINVCDKISPSSPAPGTRIPGVGRVSVHSPATGQIADVFVNCISKEQYQIFDTAARKVKLEKPLNVLFLGDSLTDYDRSRNYTDKLAFWIEKYNPGKWHFRNAGVGGDHIISLHNRLIKNPRTWRPNMYKNLFSTPWDMIFIFIGHNDTRAHYRTDGKIYQPVTPEDQVRYWRQTLQFLRQKSKAKIVLLSPSASDFNMCVQAASYNKKAGKNYVIFGEAPRVKEYFAIQKQIAKEFDLDIIDIYTPLEKMSPKSHLFTKPDGVHLSSDGNNYLSLMLLRFFSR